MIFYFKLLWSLLEGAPRSFFCNVHLRIDVFTKMVP